MFALSTLVVLLHGTHATGDRKLVLRHTDTCRLNYLHALKQLLLLVLLLLLLLLLLVNMVTIPPNDVLYAQNSL